MASHHRVAALPTTHDKSPKCSTPRRCGYLLTGQSVRGRTKRLSGELPADSRQAARNQGEGTPVDWAPANPDYCTSSGHPHKRAKRETTSAAISAQVDPTLGDCHHLALADHHSSGSPPSTVTLGSIDASGPSTWTRSSSYAASTTAAPLGHPTTYASPDLEPTSPPFSSLYGPSSFTAIPPPSSEAVTGEGCNLNPTSASTGPPSVEAGEHPLSLFACSGPPSSPQSLYHPGSAAANRAPPTSWPSGHLALLESYHQPAYHSQPAAFPAEDYLRDEEGPGTNPPFPSHPYHTFDPGLGHGVGYLQGSGHLSHYSYPVHAVEPHKPYYRNFQDDMSDQATVWVVPPTAPAEDDAVAGQEPSAASLPIRQPLERLAIVPEASSAASAVPEETSQGETSDDESSESDGEFEVVPEIGSHDDGPGGDLLIVESTGKRKRGAFPEDRREETSKTRGLGACIRCKMQRIRCKPNESQPKGPCITCLNVSRTSKKVIHHIPCRRWKVSDTTWFRQGGLNFTRRWMGTKVTDIDSGSWASQDELIHQIEVKIRYSYRGTDFDLCDRPLELDVRKFNPAPGDVIERRWNKSDRTEGCHNLEPYAVADVTATTKRLREYFANFTIPTLERAAQHSQEWIVRTTFKVAIEHYRGLPESPERIFLERLFALWFAMRYTTGSAYISGDDRLGMEPVDDPDYPLGDKISLPRMVTAQIDSILVEKFLKPWSAKVLTQLEIWFKSYNPQYWLTLYVSTFILVHEVAFSSHDRRRHAEQNKHDIGHPYNIPTGVFANALREVKYSLGNFVEKLQFGANIVLIHWHYYKTAAVDPSTVALDGQRNQELILSAKRASKQQAKRKDKEFVTVVTLPPRQSSVIVESWKHMRRRGPEFRALFESDEWEHPLYFASQMYLKDWQPRDTYRHPGWV